MAKNAKETAAKIGAQIEAQGKDVAHKIWLAGIGAYGRAFTEARDSALKVNTGTNEFFDDLVKRGEVIEGEVLTRISSNERISNASARVAKVAGAANRIQKKQRARLEDRLEDRMSSMRAALGFGKKSSKVDALHAKIDHLEEEIAALRNETKASNAKAANKSVADRLAQLTGEIEAIAKANTPKKAAKKAVTKKAATKKAAPKKAAKKPAAKKAAPKKAAPKATAKPAAVAPKAAA